MFLVDTNIVSELRKREMRGADLRVIEWNKSAHMGSQFLSVITFMELGTGVLGMERRDRVQGKLMRRWLDQCVLPSFAGRILPVDARIARIAATLHVPDKGPPNDTLIAATALAHNLTVVTRKVSDFAPTGVSILNPSSL